MTRSFELDHTYLQREQKKGVPAWLTLAAYLGVGGISFAPGLRGRFGLARLSASAAARRARHPSAPAQARSRAARERKPKTRPATV